MQSRDRRKQNLSGRHKNRIFGSFHRLPTELKKLLIQASREGLVATVKSFDEALARQQASRQRKEELAMVKRLKITQE